jgi:dTDP-4-amino-4,6-dideoxygalactose transaminase
LPSDILAAVLYAQFETRDEIYNRRKRVWTYYRDNLIDWAKPNGISMPFVPNWCEQPYHMFYLLMPDLETRQRFIAHMKAQGILCVYHYLPLHLSTMGVKFGGKEGQCPVTERVSDQLVRLPMYNTLTEAEQEQVVSAVLTFKP